MKKPKLVSHYTKVANVSGVVSKEGYSLINNISDFLCLNLVLVEPFGYWKYQYIFYKYLLELLIPLCSITMSKLVVISFLTKFCMLESTHERLKIVLNIFFKSFPNFLNLICRLYFNTS